MDSSSKSVCSSWKDMQTQLLGIILNFLVLVPDYIRFGLVCKPWRQAMRDHQQELSRKSHNQPPMLFIPAGGGVRGPLYSIPEHKLYSRPFPFPFEIRCCGSSHGWWAFAEKGNNRQATISVEFLNPFSGRKISLPIIIAFYDVLHFYYRQPKNFIHKVVLSCDPSLYPEDWIAVAIHIDISFIGASQNMWTTARNYFPQVNNAGIHQGHLYFLFGERNELAPIDLSVIIKSRNITMTTFESHPGHRVGRSMRKYLVELGQDLLLVSRNFPRHGAVRLKVRNLNDTRWDDVQDLGKFSLFMAGSGSSSICTSGFPNCRSNSIYYVYHFVDRAPADRLPNDIGIYDLATKGISRFYQHKRFNPSAV